MRMNKINNFLKLNSVFFIYAISLLFSKIASGQNSIQSFLIYYGGSLCFMIIYAICWQYVLRFNKLSIAYSYKISTLLWGMILGKLIFNETISLNMIVGGLIILIGVWVVGDKDE